MELTILAAEYNQSPALQEVGGRHLHPRNPWAVVHGAAGKSLFKQFKVVVHGVTHKQVGAPTVPWAVIKGPIEFQDFRCHRHVKVSHNVKMSHIF
jgi:hypothetical protein